MSSLHKKELLGLLQRADRESISLLTEVERLMPAPLIEARSTTAPAFGALEDGLRGTELAAAFRTYDLARDHAGDAARDWAFYLGLLLGRWLSAGPETPSCAVLADMLATAAECIEEGEAVHRLQVELQRADFAAEAAAHGLTPQEWLRRQVLDDLPPGGDEGGESPQDPAE